MTNIHQYSEPEGGYFVLVNLAKVQLPEDYPFPPHVADRPRDFKLMWFCIMELGVAAIPPTEFFTDDKLLFDRMRSDMQAATRAGDFVYLANWWLDLDVPLGDPHTRPAPPRHRRKRAAAASRPWRRPRSAWPSARWTRSSIWSANS